MNDYFSKICRELTEKSDNDKIYDTSTLQTVVNSIYLQPCIVMEILNTTEVMKYKKGEIDDIDIKTNIKKYYYIHALEMP